MRFHRFAPPSLLAVLALSLSLLTGCGESKKETPSSTPPPIGPPAIIMSQTPEYTMVGQFPQHPRGLVATLWSDGRIVRCLDLSQVGKDYMSGTIAAKELEEFLAFLKSDEVLKAPKLPHLRPHTATLQTTIPTDTGKEKWITELPNDRSIWVEVQNRLLNLPLAEGRPADGDTIRGAILEE